MHTRTIRACLFCALVVACGGRRAAPAKSAPECRDSAGDDLKMAAKTTAKAAETGAVAGYHGVKTAGASGVAWVKGGSGAAKDKWAEEADETDAATSKHANETRRAASVPVCR